MARYSLFCAGSAVNHQPINLQSDSSAPTKQTVSFTVESYAIPYRTKATY